MVVAIGLGRERLPRGRPRSSAPDEAALLDERHRR
jgi:hypothetical protein